METDDRVRGGDGHPAEPDFPPDAMLWASLTHLQLNIAQTATMCGISVRQLGYWTKQGYVTAEGLGERRMYGMDALRRILAIRRLMTEGTSLRQALKSLAGSGAPLPSRAEGVLAYISPGQRPGLAPRAVGDAPPEDADALAAALVRLFDHNHHVRDSADGLAVKLGRGVASVRYAAEALCARGVLGKMLVQDDVIYRRLEGAAG